jgi:hypothetical protein
VIYALGTKANPIVTKSTPGLVLDKWGYIVADEPPRPPACRACLPAATSSPVAPP